jgi:CHAT domain-containing protein/tetratricopeptide (TPR) repeat protein
MLIKNYFYITYKFDITVRTCVAITLFLLISCSVSNSQPLLKNESFRIKYLAEGRFDSALNYAEEKAALIRGSFGENNLQYAEVLDNLAVSHFYLGNYAKAKYYVLKEKSLRESLNATNTSNYVHSLENAAIICIKSNEYEEALDLIKKAEKNAIRIFGPDNSEYANILDSYAGAYNDLGCSENDLVFLKQADGYFTRAENIYKKNAEKSFKSFIVNKSNHASYNNNIGNSPEAESLFLEVVSLCEREYGRTDPTYASALNNLGVFYYKGGNYKSAERYFIEAVECFKNSKLAGSIHAGICINNLGAMYHDVGNYEIAARMLTEAKEIFENNCQQNHPAYAVLLSNLASIKLSEEYYASAENKDNVQLKISGQILLRADSIFEMNCRMPHPDGYAIKNNLSVWYKMVGDTTKSLKLMYDIAYESNVSLRVISVINKMNWSGLLPIAENQDAHSILEPLLISTNININDHMIDEKGLENNSKNQLASTRFLLNLFVGRATNIKNALGPYHPGYALMLKGLIPMYRSIGSDKTEEELTLEYINVISHKTLQDFSFLSESEKELYYQTRLPDWHSFIAYTLERKLKNPAITCYAYNFILQNKGLMLKSSTAMRLAIQNSKDSVLLRKYDQWLSLQKEISILYSTPVDVRKQDVTKLESKANELEKSLVQSSQLFGDYRKEWQVSWKDVRQSLKPDEAAIEFTHFKVNVKDGGSVVIYCALVVRSNSEYPEMVRLFEEKELLAIIGKDETSSVNYINTIYGTRDKADSRLYRLIWQPIEQYLTGVNKVYMSPSGLLFKISFGSISNGKDVFLCDKYQIQVKGSTGASVSENVFSAGNNISALVFGGIDYGTDNAGSMGWNYLSGTKDEGEAVRDILTKDKVEVQYMTENKATETYLKKNVKNFNILHVATHGFFFPDPNESKFKGKEEVFESATVDYRGGMRGFGVRSFLNNQNPLMRSGLVFAGANEVWNKSEMSEEDDGVLTAQEVTQIDMRKNFLVVLSACETGLGDIKGSEGVYGLQRAFKMAGVKFIITSLWQVPDKETVEYMERFYTNLLKIKEVRKAFSETQKEMRQKYDPYFWAAFELIE